MKHLENGVQCTQEFIPAMRELVAIIDARLSQHNKVTARGFAEVALALRETTAALDDVRDTIEEGHTEQTLNALGVELAGGLDRVIASLENIGRNLQGSGGGT